MFVLHITPEAGLAINRLVASQGGGGLRISARSTSPAFDLTVTSLARETDVVVTEETTGARVMVDSLTAEYVEDKTLDVDDTVESTARFRLGGQGTTSR